MTEMRSYRALVSSDWNECLAPCGPFDFISFTYPELKARFQAIFQEYTSNVITLGEAIGRLQGLLPGSITEQQMDAYLEQSFQTYAGVPHLIDWCNDHGILFMINTTGMLGYFQRIFAKGLLPPVPALSAHPMTCYARRKTDPRHVYELFEIQDKAKHTESVMRLLDIPPQKVIIMGDSGGDGPHFEWGRSVGALLVGSMTKTSLEAYCRSKGISIDVRFGVSGTAGSAKDRDREFQVDFVDLLPTIEEILA
jgi:2-hydroxy-3-keto-5-methylthiopentenyl-1-phosphate phosphatase